MKNKILTAALTIVLAVAGSATFAQTNKKAEEARKDVAESQKDLREAKIDSAADFQKFKNEAELKISDNQVKIKELKAKKLTGTKEKNEKYDRKVAALEKKNNDLKRKIEKCDGTKTAMWPSFKREFTHDIDELGNAIRDIGVNNMN